MHECGKNLLKHKKCKKFGQFEFPALFWFIIYPSICNFPYFLTNKQKTKIQIQITQISYIFCALVFEYYFLLMSILLKGKVWRRREKVA